jgi:hypothetical protein
MDSLNVMELAPAVKSAPKPHIPRTWQKHLVVVCPQCSRTVTGPGIRKWLHCPRCGGDL